eukprot:m.1915 g.1915  ORF g.1915 m.1915 type:complete len:58 (-) comp1184_c0_seq1:464-637(-)
MSLFSVTTFWIPEMRPGHRAGLRAPIRSTLALLIDSSVGPLFTCGDSWSVEMAINGG